MSERTKRIWRGLVNYANSTPETIDVDGFRRTVAYCMPWYVAASGLGPFPFLNEEGELWEAQEYHPRIQALLRWLIAKPEERKEREALHFLLEHMEHIKWSLAEVERPEHIEAELKRLNYTPAELERFHEQAERYWADATKLVTPPGSKLGEAPLILKRGDSLLGIRTPAKEYLDLADPICDFVLTEYQKYREREHSRKDKAPPPLVPIFACPNCNKLVMPERIGRRKYCADCSDKARAKSYLQKASPDENRDYQWLYRLKNTPNFRKTRLGNAKVKRRLDEIRARQKNSSRCQNLLLEMRLHVAPTTL